uniref:Uncharacterized protein n=1 Tax=Arion vulgaris TaxID=1028688 RepID=A0A0B6YAP6_9EUPU
MDNVYQTNKKPKSLSHKLSPQTAQNKIGGQNFRYQSSHESQDSKHPYSVAEGPGEIGR